MPDVTTPKLTPAQRRVVEALREGGRLYSFGPTNWRDPTYWYVETGSDRVYIARRTFLSLVDRKLLKGGAREGTLAVGRTEWLLTAETPTDV